MTDQTQALTVETRPRPSMAVGGNVGALIPQDIEQAFRIASALAQSGMTPNGFKTPETCFVAIMAGAELGLPPFQSLQSFAIINNRPTLWGDALMAVVRTNGFKVREWLEGEGDEMTAYCEVTRPDNGDTAEASFSVDDAKTAGLWKKGGPWTSAPKRMLKMRARSFAIRDGAADVLRGFQIREEVEDYAEPLPSDAAPKAGTGLLARLETTQTLATEGFGIRNLADEAGEAAPAAEPKPKRRTNKAVAAEALEAIAEAEPDVVETTTADQADAAEDAAFEADAGTFEVVPDTRQRPTVGEVVQHVVEAATAIIAPDPENLPADAQVEETATLTPATVIDGPAPADTLYFMADKEAFPSGRRVVFLNGNSEKEAIDDTPDVPTYTGHAPKAPPKPVEREPITTAPALEWTAQDDFTAELNGAKDGAEVVLAVRTLLASGECGTPDLKRAARVKAWLRVIDLNAGGAKIDPVADPFLMSAFIEWSEDVEAVQSMLPLAAEQEWFQAGGETMQNGVSRAIMDRVAALTGA